MVLRLIFKSLIHFEFILMCFLPPVFPSSHSSGLTFDSTASWAESALLLHVHPAFISAIALTTEHSCPCFCLLFLLESKLLQDRATSLYQHTFIRAGV